MNLWYLHLSAALLLVFIGMFMHWSIVVAGALWPFWPLVRELLHRRKARRR